MNNHKEYWNTEFSKHHYIWGKIPSKSADIALSLFREHKINKILVPGSGYGRNSKLFSTAGYDVTGIEISEEACTLAKIFDPATKVYNGSILDDKIVQDSFEAIYCFNVLQLFLKADRIKIINRKAQLLAKNGFMFFTGISDKDLSFGEGQEIEKNTFAVKPDKILHYFTFEDMKEHFKGFKIIKIGSLEDRINHSFYGIKTYKIRYIYVCR